MTDDEACIGRCYFGCKRLKENVSNEELRHYMNRKQSGSQLNKQLKQKQVKEPTVQDEHCRSS